MMKMVTTKSNDLKPFQTIHKTILSKKPPKSLLRNKKDIRRNLEL